MELRPIHKKEKRSYKRMFPILIGTLIILIMVLSVLDLNTNDGEKLKYNGYKFVKINNKWVTYINNNPVYFDYSPNNLEQINADVNYGSMLQASKLYLSFDQEQTRELMKDKNILGFAGQLVLACPVDSEACKTQNLPLKNCNDADVSTGIILIISSNDTSIMFSNNCLELKGSHDDLIKIINKLVLKRLGIMQ